MVGFGWWGCAKKGLSVDDEKQQKGNFVFALQGT